MARSKEQSVKELEKQKDVLIKKQESFKAKIEDYGAKVKELEAEISDLELHINAQKWLDHVAAKESKTEKKPSVEEHSHEDTVSLHDPKLFA